MIKYLEGNVVMNARDITDISEYAFLHLQQVRNLHITVEVLDKDDNTIDTIQGLSTGGSVNVSNTSLIRRTGNLSFILFENLLPKKDSLLWMTNKIRVYAGIENVSAFNNTVTHFCLGTFFITEPNVDIESSNRSITIALQDKMMQWEDTQLETKMQIPAGTPLHTAMYELVTYFGEWKTDIEFTDLIVPYTLEFNEGDNILSVITKLRDLYMDWDCYYDIDGTFVFRKMQLQKPDGEPVSWVFDKSGDHITGFSEGFTYKGVKNRVLVIGAMNETTGLTPRAEASISNVLSPFHANEIGLRTKVITESTYGNVAQCESRAKYELFRSSSLQESLNINTIPIYYLDANDLIEIRNPATKEIERYIIDSISIGLGVGDTMGISCHKLYYDEFFTNGSIDEYRASADAVIGNIANKGWLSLSEKRIKDYYGLEGSGNLLKVRFEHQTVGGVTAYVTGYTSTKSQTLTIDLSDFANATGDSGDTGFSKGDYSDRILGHEMLHAVMNDAFGVTKTIELPVWFKEGTAEFIHGADERLKTVILENSVINNAKLTNLISIATGLLSEGAWESVSEHYTAGYVIVKYLDKKMLSGKDWKNLMNDIKVSVKTGNIALKDAIVNNTVYGSYDAFVSDFSANAFNYVKTQVTLNLTGDELDTGSVAGSDHRGNTPLSAEDVFDNVGSGGILSYGFDVQFDRP